ncbi:MAG: ATP-binding protein, partial [Bdellovibrionota bacterium]
WQFFLRRKAVRALNAAQVHIHSRENKIATILKNAPIVFSAIDSKGIFHISEGKGLEKLGRKDNQSVGLSIFEMHNQSPIILDAVKRALGGEMVSTTFVLNNISYDLFIGPERNIKNEVIGASMISVDITDRKRIENEKAQLEIREQTALETSKLKSEFLATMSHEIRTPINGVLGLTSLLLGTSLDQRQKEYVESIKISGSSLLSVINDILDFSKIEAGKLDFEELDFDLPSFIRHSLKSLSFAANEKNIFLKTEIDPNLQIWVKGDPNRFRQILNNLVSNAIKFTVKGQVVVRVTQIETSPERLGVRVEIQDTGIGIRKESLEKMFKAFSQAEASMARRFGGTGLGLSICKQLVEKMGGQIGVESVEDRGSTFWFTLPFSYGKPLAENEKVKMKPIHSGGEPRPRILVAEDNKINQLVTTAMLNQLGCEFVVVIDGYEAISALEKEDFDLVLMDCQMPSMDGLEATRRIRASPSTRNRNIPILALTANAMQGDREACLKAGMDDYISKPISFEDLTSAIARWMEVRRKRA